MDKEFLMKFCGDEDYRKEISQPWSRGTFTYATNGHIMIRMPVIAEIPDNPATPDASKAIAKFNVSVPAVEIPDLPPQRKSQCEECEGDGVNYRCPECEGVGEVFWRLARHEYSADCKECDGAGKVKKCPVCNGTGTKIEGFSVKVGDALFNREYLALLKELPGIKLYPQKINEQKREYPPSSFTFDGGDGLIMPMRA